MKVKTAFARWARAKSVGKYNHTATTNRIVTMYDLSNVSNVLLCPPDAI